MTTKECHKKPLKKGQRVQHEIEKAFGTVVKHVPKTNTALILWDGQKCPHMAHLGKISKVG